MKRLIFIATLCAATPAHAQQTIDHSAHHPAPAQAQTALADGEVRKVDLNAGKITLRHGPISSIDMPPMTMVFRVSDPALLKRVKAGDKIRFAAKKDGAAFVVTHIEAAP